MHQVLMPEFTPDQHIQLLLFSDEVKNSVRYRNPIITFFNVFVLCISSWYFGYTLVQLSCLPSSVLQSAFTEYILSPSVLGVLIGMLTFGCGVGIFVSSYFVERLSRKKFLLVINVLTICTCGVIQINNVYALGVSRIFQGITAGCYLKVLPLYIQQITPSQITVHFTHWPQIFTVIGVDTAYILELLFNAAQLTDEIYWRVIFGIPPVMIIIQSVLLVLFIPNSPIQMIQANEIEQAKKIYKKFYVEKHINKVIRENVAKMFVKKIKQMNVWEYNEAKLKINQSLEMKEAMNLLVERQLEASQIERPSKYNQLAQIPNNSPVSPQLEQKYIEINHNLDKLRRNFSPSQIILGFILAQAFHMTGILAIVTQAGQVQNIVSPDVSQITPVTITTVQLALTIFSIYIIRGMGLYPNIVFGLLTMGILHIFNGIFFYYITWRPSTSLTFVTFIVNMIIFGSSIGNSIPLAVSQLVPERLIPYATVISWLGATFCIIALPIVIDVMKNNGYPIFFFFGCWTILSAICIMFFLIKSKVF